MASYILQTYTPPPPPVLSGRRRAGPQITTWNRPEFPELTPGPELESPSIRWLFLHQLDSVAAVRRHVAFYVKEHNTTIPHSAFRGQTPDEMYFGRDDGVPDRLAEARVLARERRMEENRAQRCAVCA